jgi:hypothetical protein
MRIRPIALGVVSIPIRAVAKQLVVVPGRVNITVGRHPIAVPGQSLELSAFAILQSIHFL